MTYGNIVVNGASTPQQTGQALRRALDAHTKELVQRLRAGSIA